MPAGCHTNRLGALAENDDLLSLPLSSKGGEGNGIATSKHRDAWQEQPLDPHIERDLHAPDCGYSAHDRGRGASHRRDQP